MRVLPTTVAASALASLAVAGPCEFVVTCFELDRITFPPCSPAEAAEFELVAPALQACQDISYFFNDNQPWPVNDRALYCNPASPCGSLVPYLTNVRSYAGVCDKFKPFYGVMQTFHGYCRNEPEAQLPGDNGLLASLKSKTSRPTPAPSRPVNAETPEPIPNHEIPAPTAKGQTSAPSSTPSPTKASDNNADANAKTASGASALATTSRSVWVSITAVTMYSAWTA